MAKKTNGSRTYEDLVLDGMEARQQADDANWRLGDLAAEVVGGYGEGKLQDFAEKIGVEYKTLRNYRRIAKLFSENARRRAYLAFGHYDAVAARKDAESWLGRAERRRWSIRELRDALKDADDRVRVEQAARRAASIEHDSNFHRGDARELIDDPVRGLEDGTVKLVLTDPPFGMDRKSPSADAAERYRIEGDQTRDQAAELLRAVLQRLAPKLRDDAMCAVFCWWNDTVLQGVVEEFFDVHGRVRWDKGHGPGGNFFIYDAEDIIIGTRKGAPLLPTFFFPFHGTLLYARPAEFVRIHPMEKPDLLLSELILATTVERDIVVDPFAGSGASLAAAANLGRAYWGAELNKNATGREMTWYARGLERLRGTSMLTKDMIEEKLSEVYRLGRYDFRNVPHYALDYRIRRHPKYHDHDCEREGCEAADRLAEAYPFVRPTYKVVGGRAVRITGMRPDGTVILATDKDTAGRGTRKRATSAKRPRAAKRKTA
ncbi:MAG: hypothetical protein A2148_08515 [Chloroflexi bacterium RBG_16_68_14]|nr:MAG: hypothetical protein A2148_08515 [Chloroflexi bacterium RBG_16_68_14]